MDYENERKMQIKEIEELWRDATGKGLRELDAAIKKRFETSTGRESLTFESIRTVREGLLKLKGENNVKK
jgi:hypothetical protein